MSLQRQTRIACDIPDCGALGPWVSIGGMAPYDAQWAAWRTIRALGWGMDQYGGHCCPQHNPRLRVVGRIAELAAQGMPDRRIGERLGLNRRQVQYLRRCNNIPGQPTGRPSVLVGA